MLSCAVVGAQKVLCDISHCFIVFGKVLLPARSITALKLLCQVDRAFSKVTLPLFFLLLKPPLCGRSFLLLGRCYNVAQTSLG